MSATLERRDPGVFGRIITGNDVERAALATLRAHMPDYLREVERQAGGDPGSLPAPRGYIVASQFQYRPEDQLPVVVVISPGLAGPPRRDGDGRVMARWSLAAGVVTAAAERARENAMSYVGALRALLLQHQTLDGLALDVEWQDEEYDSAPFDVTRTLFSARVVASVTVPDVVSYGHGPDGPWGPAPDPTDPTDPTLWPRVKRTDVRVVPVKTPIELELAKREE